MEFKIITKDNEWDEAIKASPQATVYHTSNWKKVVEKHGCKGYLIVAEDRGNISGIFPVFITKSKLFHLKQFTSIPFCDQESIIINENTDDTIKTLFDGLSHLVNEFKPNRTILTTNLILFQGSKVFPRCRYLYKTDGLTEENAWKNLGRARHSIKRGLNKGVKCVVKNNLGVYDVCVDMFDDMVKRHNVKLLKYSRQFFIDLEKFMKDYIKVFILETKEDIIAVSIAFKFNENLYSWTFLTYSKMLAYNPGDLIVWGEIKWAIKNGCKCIDFGTVPLGTELGFHRFKNKYKTHLEKMYLFHINHSKKSNFEDLVSSVGKIFVKPI